MKGKELRPGFPGLPLDFARPPQALRPYLRIGTCSWKYNTWKGLLYDPGKSYRPEDDLRDYALRLHGGDRLEIEKETAEVWDRIISPKPEAIAAAARIVRSNARNRVITYVNFNNHFEGSAPLTIQRLLEALS
jgi:uncharacterized protein YecE (DUF72 family)